MNKIIVYLVIASIMFSGCMNCLVRFPTTSPKIEACYECTQTMAAFVIAGSFPQLMSGCGGGLEWYNIFTVPFIGHCLCYIYIIKNSNQLSERRQR